MKNSARGELVEPCELSVVAMKSLLEWYISDKPLPENLRKPGILSKDSNTRFFPESAGKRQICFCVLCIAMFKSLRTLRKLSGGPWLSKKGICSRQDAKNAK
jgi:hypothetical protein